jgi:CMP-N,N'-diacetyllegionaminic acid synthase
MKKILAIIPARGGSKGIPKKNIKIINGKPLIFWSIKTALDAGFYDVVVSTDSEEIADIAINFGATVHELRSNELSQDETPTEPVLLDVFNKYYLKSHIDAIALLQPTSPIRDLESVRGSIAKFRNLNSDSLLSVVKTHSFFWKNINSPNSLHSFEVRKRRQDLLEEDILYRENGSIYITKIDVLMNCKNRLGGKISMYEMSEYESYEIDTMEDFIIVESLMRHKEYGNN